jgi:hypothetical protein
VNRVRGNLYFHYYATLALRRHGGEAWRRWNADLQPLLLENQAADGSWLPISIYAEYAGDTSRDRSYTTAMCVLMLEVYYRYFTPLLEEHAERAAVEPPPGRLEILEVRPGSPIARLGVQAGDVLLRVGATAVHTLTDLDDAQAAQAGQRRTRLTLERDGERFTVDLPGRLTGFRVIERDGSL